MAKLSSGEMRSMFQPVMTDCIVAAMTCTNNYFYQNQLC